MSVMTTTYSPVAEAAEEIRYGESAAPDSKDTDLYTADQLISAYEAGVVEGRSLEEKLMREKFRENLKKSFDLANKFYSVVGKNIPNARRGLFIRADSVTNFSALILVRDKDYCSNRMLDVISVGHAIEEEEEDSTYTIEFRYSSFTRNTDLDLIICDGFYGVKETGTT